MIYCMRETFVIIIAQMEVDHFKQICAHNCPSVWVDSIQQPLQHKTLWVLQF